MVESVSSAEKLIDEATDMVEKDVFGEVQADEVDEKEVEVEGKLSNDFCLPKDPKKGVFVSRGGVGNVLMYANGYCGF